MNSVWVHNLDPFAIQFTDTFGIRWYGLAYLAGFFLGYLAIVMMYRRGRTQFKSEEQIADFITWVAGGVLIGGRVGYALFYDPSLFIRFDEGFPWWGLLRVNEGGMASHGGILGVMFVSWLYSRRHQMSFLHCLDLTVFGGALGFMFGRLANFVNGELYGRAAEGVAWAVKFPQELELWVSREFDRLKELGPSVEALGRSASEWQQLLENYASNTGGARATVRETLEALVTAVQNGNVKVTEALGQVLTARHPSQIYQMILEGLLVFLFLCWVWRYPRKPGVISGWFGASYCAARIIGEQYRLPDANIGFQLWGLTRGQWLSIAMLSVAIVWIIAAVRANRPKMGGWWPSP